VLTHLRLSVHMQSDCHSSQFELRRLCDICEHAAASLSNVLRKKVENIYHFSQWAILVVRILFAARSTLIYCGFYRETPHSQDRSKSPCACVPAITGNAKTLGSMAMVVSDHGASPIRGDAFQADSPAVARFLCIFTVRRLEYLRRATRLKIHSGNRDNLSPRQSFRIP
jgi:hypothetical protein